MSSIASWAFGTDQHQTVPGKLLLEGSDGSLYHVAEISAGFWPKSAYVEKGLTTRVPVVVRLREWSTLRACPIFWYSVMVLVFAVFVAASLINSTPAALEGGEAVDFIQYWTSYESKSDMNGKQ
ncbi:MAG: hypothetical protein KVP17_005262 [Porospora cf. gigantea B]|uniref:uncharacterized protein n=1 Tax=Porospora cf. gigantea B TaxID=2853592 RepID=UPI003571DC63|nr:MAG: hypothetical protein KVP17_005262 [Porospora cf. gigantea B]